MTMKWYLLIPVVWAVLMVWVIVAIARREAHRSKSLRERFEFANRPHPVRSPVPAHLCEDCALPWAACLCHRGREAARRNLERYWRRTGAKP